MSNYIPLSELSGYDDDRVIWRVELPPYVPAENIGINIPRLGRLARLSGLESLRVSTYSGDTTKITPGIDSVNEHGHVTASMNASVTKADLQHNSVDASEDYIPSEYQWQKGSISINSSELDYRIGEQGKLRDPEVWAKELNTALKQGIRGASIKSIMEKPHLADKLRTPMLLGIFTVMNVIEGDHGFKFIEDDLINLAVYQMLVSPTLDTLLRKLPLKKRRLSIFPGVQVDRLVAVNGLNTTLPLAKKLRGK